MRIFRVTPSAKLTPTVFWDSEGIIFIIYMPKGQTVTGTYYAGLIPKVREVKKEIPRGKLSPGRIVSSR